MGQNVSKAYTRLEEYSSIETSLQFYGEVSSSSRGAIIESVTDETFGSANNLLKSTDVNICSNNKPEEEKDDSWIVKRHEEKARATVALCNVSHIYGFDIDTTGFEEICPTHAVVEAFKVSEDSRNEGYWTALIQEEPLKQDSHNFFRMHDEDSVYSHVRLTVAPGGGIARFRTYGSVIPDVSDLNKEYNLAAANDGARIVRWSDNSYRNKPNVLLENGKLTTSGWLTPRSRNKDRNDFIVIQLTAPGTLNSIVIDTTGFLGNAAKAVYIDGCRSTEDDPYQETSVQWKSLVPSSLVKDNNVETFAITCQDVISHVRLTLLPDGGIQQIKCFGFLEKDHEQSNLLSTLFDKKVKHDNRSSIPKRKSSRKKMSQPPAIEDRDLFEKTIIEELNGSTTQLPTPIIEKPNRFSQSLSTKDQLELARSEKPAVEQLNATDIPLAPRNNLMDTTATLNIDTTVEEDISISQLNSTTQLVETDQVTTIKYTLNGTSSEPLMEHPKKVKQTRKRKSIEPEPLRASALPKAKVPRQEKEAVHTVKVESTPALIPPKRGRGRPRKFPISQ